MKEEKKNIDGDIHEALRRYCTNNVPELPIDFSERVLRRLPVSEQRKTRCVYWAWAVSGWVASLVVFACWWWLHTECPVDEEKYMTADLLWEEEPLVVVPQEESDISSCSTSVPLVEQSAKKASSGICLSTYVVGKEMLVVESVVSTRQEEIEEMLQERFDRGGEEMNLLREELIIN